MLTIILSDHISKLLDFLLSHVWISLLSKVDSLNLFNLKFSLVSPHRARALLFVVDVKFHADPTKASVTHFANHMVATVNFFNNLLA